SSTTSLFGVIGKISPSLCPTRFIVILYSFSILGITFTVTGVLILSNPRSQHVFFRCFETRSKFLDSGFGSNLLPRQYIKHLSSLFCIFIVAFLFLIFFFNIINFFFFYGFYLFILFIIFVLLCFYFIFYIFVFY